jgi:hypothetical protein
MKKYIPVFGDQSLFDDAPEDAVFVRYGKESYIFKESMLGCTIGSLRDAPIVAMRRIEEAPEPKRWTWEDKKAGRLPEVVAKCRQGHKDEIVVAVTEKFVVTECQDMSVCTTRKDVFMRSYNPIETPEEKAQRERDEWIDNAQNKWDQSGAKGGFLEFIYDMQLSGELPPVQAKDGV